MIGRSGPAPWLRSILKPSGTHSDRRAVASGPLSVGARTAEAARRDRGGESYVSQL